MSSQDTAGISFSHAPDHNGYRLLELPPELAALLDGPDAPVLCLETCPTTGSAVLRSPDQKYTLRQRNTSNSIILVAPKDRDEQLGPAASDGQAADGIENTPKPGLTAFATLHESIELIRESSDKPAAKPANSVGKWHERFGRNR
ncbi:hypothetical protein BROUX41_005907 [Berkeleyomyces rouxiae]|uniref:uncharacterized protein n=1 Tax=Berkeleyomyces rouxiae TaxID=2035830 RepID=UPI003B8089AE